MHNLSCAYSSTGQDAHLSHGTVARATGRSRREDPAKTELASRVPQEGVPQPTGYPRAPSPRALLDGKEQEKHMHPTTKWEQRKSADMAGKRLYQRRRDIDRLREERELERQLREPLQ